MGVPRLLIKHETIGCFEIKERNVWLASCILFGLMENECFLVMGDVINDNKTWLIICFFYCALTLWAVNSLRLDATAALWWNAFAYSPASPWTLLGWSTGALERHLKGEPVTACASGCELRVSRLLLHSHVPLDHTIPTVFNEVNDLYFHPCFSFVENCGQGAWWHTRYTIYIKLFGFVFVLFFGVCFCHFLVSSSRVWMILEKHSLKNLMMAAFGNKVYSKCALSAPTFPVSWVCSSPAVRYFNQG